MTILKSKNNKISYNIYKILGKIDTFTCFNTLFGLSIISLTKSCYPECERPTSLRHPARGDNLKNYPAPAYNKVGQP